MGKIRNLVKLVLTTTWTNTQIARMAGVSKNTVGRYRELAAKKRYRWEELAELSDPQLDACFNSVLRRLGKKRPPDYAEVHAEMQQKGMTLLLLWEEYRTPQPEDALSYSQFTHGYRGYVHSIDRVMRQTYLPGQMGFVDFSGLRPKYLDQATGQDVYVELFVGVLGFSQYTFAMCTATQTLPDWVEAHSRMFAFFGGAPEGTVPDNLKAAVDRPGRDAVINRTYDELADHYGTHILPARSRHPQDKAYVELGVQLVQRWILMRLRKRTFFSLQEINDAIAELLTYLNNRTFKRLPGCRRSRFEEHERGQLIPLPEEPYVLAEWTGELRVDNGYHLLVDGHWYSVPHRLVGQRVCARSTATTVEIFHHHVRAAAHPRSAVVGGRTTDPAHMPDHHRAYAERTPEHYRIWARSVGPHVLAVVEHQFDRASPMLGLPACDALSRLVRTHGAADVEAAAGRAIDIRSLTVKTVKSLLATGRHRRPRASSTTSNALQQHANLRGGDYYRQNTSET